MISSRRSNGFVATNLPEETSNVVQVTEHPQHVYKIRKSEPASARLALPSTHTRLY